MLNIVIDTCRILVAQLLDSLLFIRDASFSGVRLVRGVTALHLGEGFRGRKGGLCSLLLMRICSKEK